MATVLVTGANRGLGREFALQYAAGGWDVIATVRNEAAAALLRPELPAARIETLDAADFAAVESLADRLDDTPIDLFIANAGMSDAPEIDSRADAQTWLNVLAVNAVSPVLLARLLASNVAAAKGKMAAISSRMGSIADSSGGYIGYRSSKAALNAAWYALSQELDAIPMILFHPGWVQTDMGGPHAQITPRESVAGMRKVLAAATLRPSGTSVDSRVNPLPW